MLQAAEDVGKALGLGTKWFNAGPASLLNLGLPSGFTQRMYTRNYKSLTVHLAGILDQICFKLYASVDQGPKSKHFTDLIALKPSKKDLEIAKDWCMTHDVSEDFAILINQVTTKIHETAEL